MTTDSRSTVEKALQVLIALSEEHDEVGTTDLSRKLNMHKATMSRILLKLAEYGFVYKNKETGKYWLGPEIHHCSSIMADINYSQIMEFARPHIRALRDAIGETVSLEVWLGNSTIPAFSELSRHVLRIVPPPGEPLPLHAAAGAKAILSFTHAERVDVLLEGDLPALTENTITDPAVLKERLVEYNKQGYSTDLEEFHTGICAIGVPIFDQFTQPVGAIVVLVPATRFTQDQVAAIVPSLKKKAAAIKTQLSMQGH